MQKTWYQSKVMWINTLTLIAGILVTMQDASWLMESYGGLVLAALGVVNVGLRLVTNKSIK